MLNTKKLYLLNLIWRLLPESSFFEFKNTLLRWAGAKIGSDVRITSSVTINGALNLEIGNNVFIGGHTHLLGSKGSAIILEDHSTISSFVILCTGYHRWSTEGNSITKEGRFGNICIRSGSAILARVFIQPGVTVGKMALVAPCACVAKDVPDYMFVAGVPAKILRDLREQPIED